MRVAHFPVVYVIGHPLMGFFFFYVLMISCFGGKILWMKDFPACHVPYD